MVIPVPLSDKHNYSRHCFTGSCHSCLGWKRSKELHKRIPCECDCHNKDNKEISE